MYFRKIAVPVDMLFTARAILVDGYFGVTFFTDIFIFDSFNPIAFSLFFLGHNLPPG
jgi:hypothetical protein